jgi:hypothetical protein
MQTMPQELTRRMISAGDMGFQGIRNSEGIRNSDTHRNSGIQTHQLPSTVGREFRHPSTPINCRSEQLARTSALEAARRSETEVIESIVACA